MLNFACGHFEVVDDGEDEKLSCKETSIETK
jgi:hypothetical protein